MPLPARRAAAAAAIAAVAYCALRRHGGRVLALLFGDLAGLVKVALRAVRSGQAFRPACVLTDADPDVACEYDVRVPVRGAGGYCTANVFRSRSAGAARVPAVMCAHPYDNRLIPALGRTPLGGPPHQYRAIPQAGRPRFSTLTSWESPDPNFWCAAGYAVVNMNLPGFGSSPGEPRVCTDAQCDAFYDAIEWVAAQPWCNGRVALSGVSFLAISQYHVAANRNHGGAPPSLRCICPWEGITDMYGDLLNCGGVPEAGFPAFWWETEVKTTCDARAFAAVECLPHEMLKLHPLPDAYLREKVPDLERIEVPMLVCASFADHMLHTQGSVRAFVRAASKEKYLYTHRWLKWDAYYSPEVLELTRRFFDRYCKDGAPPPPPPRVRLEVRSARDVVREVRAELEWPLARTVYTPAYLDAARGRLADACPAAAATAEYPGTGGSAVFRYTFAAETELTGHFKLRVFVEARGADDACVFAVVRKRDGAGREVPFYGTVGMKADGVTRGQARAALRELDAAASVEHLPVHAFRAERRLRQGEVVPVDIALMPSATHFAAGEGIELEVSSQEVIPNPPFIRRPTAESRRATHVIHTGGATGSYLLLPVIPGAVPAP